MLTRILALVLKEFLALLKDPKSRFAVIGPPIIQMIVFGYAASYDLKHVPLAVYNEDASAASRELVARLTGSPNIELVRTITRQEQIAPLIDTREAMVVVHIGPEFSGDLLRGRPAPVQLLVDGRNSNTATIALNYCRTIVQDFSEHWAQTHGLGSPPARVQFRAWFNPNLESRWFIVPGVVGLLTMVVTILVTSMSVAREREQGTFDQLLVTPLRPREIVIGKALPGFLIGIVEGTLVVTVATLWFKVPLRGNLLTLYCGLSLFLLSTIGVGLMISSMSATMQQALLGSFLFMTPAIVLSGFATPIANMPHWVQVVTYLNPMRYFMTILRAVFLEGATMASLANQFWPLAVIGLTCLTVAGVMFRRRMY